VFGRPKPCALDLVDALNDGMNHNFLNGYPALDAAIGLYSGTVVCGVLDSGCHSEFTVIGDAVNVAQRLEALAKTLSTPLSVSSDLIAQLKGPAPPANWQLQSSAQLPGRRVPIDVLILAENSTGSRISATRPEVCTPPSRDRPSNPSFRPATQVSDSRLP
jgi:adenylate cyclase